MAYATCGSSALQHAILQVWTSAVGARSLHELQTRNIEKCESSFRLNFLDPFAVLNYIPHLRQNVPREVFDDQPPFVIREEILSGSWSEGLFFYGRSNTSTPDLDFMFVLEHISFSEEVQQSGNLTFKEDTPFVYAYITDEHALKMWEDFLVDQDHGPRKRLSSKKLKERLYENYRKLQLSQVGHAESKDVEEGAAMYICHADMFNSRTLLALSGSLISQFSTDTETDRLIAKVRYVADKHYNHFTGCDIVLAISCDGWPSCAREWITRDRKWPQDDLVQKVTRDGFHIVPKSSAEGDFRLSFSYAETTLIENLTELQHKVLRSFKAVVKYHQNTWSPNIKEILKTYHLKTIAFWYFEKRKQDSFTEETVATHLVLLLQELAECLRSRELPMYFMPKVNLFKDVENPEEAIDIAEKIESLSQDFPLIIKGLENITCGFAWQLGMINNFVKIEANMKESSHLHKAYSNKASTVFDTIDKWSQFLKPMASIKFQSQESERNHFTDKAKELKTQHFHTLDTDTFLDLD